MWDPHHVVELLEEVDSNSAGEDGVVGESIDMIICLFDLIFKTNPDITHEEITAYTEKKLKKWKTLYGEHHYE